MRGSQSGQGNLTQNQARLAAQEILAYAQSIEQAINKLRQRGCSESELDIQNNIWLRVNGTPPYTPTDNSGARPDGTCALFLPTGANLKAMTIPLKYTDTKGQTIPATSFAPGSYIVVVLDIPWLTGGTSKADLSLHAIFLTDQICIEMNKLLGVSNNGSTPPLAKTLAARDTQPPILQPPIDLLICLGKSPINKHFVYRVQYTTV